TGLGWILFLVGPILRTAAGRSIVFIHVVVHILGRGAISHAHSLHAASTHPFSATPISAFLLPLAVMPTPFTSAKGFCQGAKGNQGKAQGDHGHENQL
ncbi:MAG: hypothetical protein EBW54_11255, partial [Betaproteobacteria bacterium]|nr:hypothetical protein [Betaproteobacteria bacterium]